MKPTRFSEKVDKFAIERNNWNRNCHRYNLNPSDFHQVITLNYGRLHGKYKVVDLKPRSKKYPIVVEEVGNDKKRWELPVGIVRDLLTLTVRAEY